MIKVLIADDEKNICLMMKKMVNWQEYGMEVIEIVHNGVDALHVIETEKPQLVISDIRMPGYDGLELVKRTRELNLETDFIIISGYKQFEYAHTALNLGVENYLLKPIDKSELEEALKKIAQKHIVNVKKAEEEEELKEQALSSKKRIRQHFLSDIMEKTGSFRRTQMEQNGIESTYGFEQDYFVAIFAKLDGEEKGQDISGLLHMMEDMIEQDFQVGESEYINSRVNSGIITVLNYKQEDKPNVAISIERTFRKLLRELEKFRGYHITVGVGTEQNNIAGTAASIAEAIHAVKCRGKAGLDRVIQYEQLHYQDVDVRSMLEESRREMENMVTALDYDAFQGRATKCLEEIQCVPFYSPVAFYSYIEGLVAIAGEVFRKNQVDEELICQMEEDAQEEMDFYVNVGEMSYRVLEVMRKCFEELLSERKNRGQRPIRMAKQYIQENYYNQVSQEEVAEAIGLSSSYLSTMFKKELGINFSDYLTSCRMDAAKDLLKNTDTSIVEIAAKVGYTDSKYFSKAFHKVVGLKPSVYRKMYR